MVYKNFRSEFKCSPAGKTIVVVGGLHGNEQSSVYAVDQLVMELEQKQFSPINVKSIIVYNFVNYDGILSRDRLYNKSIDLNRAFTNKKSKIEAIEMIKKDVKSADAVIDVHSSFHTTEFLYIDDDKYAQSYMDLCKKLNINFVITEIVNENTLKSYVNGFSSKFGFTLEINQDDNNIDTISASRCVSILKNLITNIPFFTKTASTKESKLKALRTITADINGLVRFYENLPGKFVKRGTQIGYILNMDKTKMMSLYAPCDGIIVLYVSNMSYMSVGDIIYTIQPVN